MYSARHILVCVLALLVVSIPASADEMSVGNQWEYQHAVTGKMMFSVDKNTRTVDVKQEGHSTTKVVAVKERKPDGGVVYLVQSSETWDQGTNAKPKEMLTETLSLVTKKGIYGLAHKASGLEGILSNEWTREEPPVLERPAELKVGKTWSVGTVHESGISMRTTARVTGVETVEVLAGRFRNCFKVVSKCDKITGTVGSGTIKSGKSVTTDWICEGVGVVKSERVSEMVFVPATGSPDDFKQVSVTRRATKELLPGYTVK